MRAREKTRARMRGGREGGREREGERGREREGEREVFAMVNSFFFLTSQIYYLYVPGSFKHL